MVKKFAIVENGKVTNIAKAAEALAANWIESETAAIGDDYDGATFTRPAPANPVPLVVTRFQLRVALYNAGHLDTARTAINSRAGIDKMAWEDVFEFRRDSPFIQKLKDDIGVSDTALDNLFRAAALVEA